MGRTVRWMSHENVCQIFTKQLRTVSSLQIFPPECRLLFHLLPPRTSQTATHLNKCKNVGGSSSSSNYLNQQNSEVRFYAQTLASPPLTTSVTKQCRPNWPKSYLKSTPKSYQGVLLRKIMIKSLRILPKALRSRPRRWKIAQSGHTVDDPHDGLW